jgi:PAS domain S-box-containing protein
VKVRETGQPQELEVTSPDGREWFMRGYPVRDANGDIAGVVEFTLDITERKRAEKAIRESEEKFKAITGSAKDAIIIMDNEGNISYWNEAAENIFGYSAHEALGKELHIFLAPQEYHDAYRRGILTFKTTGHGPAVGKTLELEAVRKDGTIFPIELSVSTVKIDEKWQATGIVRDITQRKQTDKELMEYRQHLEELVEERTFKLTKANKELELEIMERQRAEEALRESEDRYRRITEAITDYIYTVTIQDGRPVETIHGPACVAVTGYMPEDFRVNPYLWIQMVHEEDRAVVQKQAEYILSGQDAQPVEHRIFRKDGAMRWVRNTLVPHYDPDGTLLAYDGLVRDIHVRKRVEEALRKSEERYRSVVEDQTELICRFLPDGILTFVNEAYCQYFGKKPEELIGHSFMPLIPEEDQETVRKQFTSLSPETPVVTYEHRVVTPDGKIRWQHWGDRAIFCLLYTSPSPRDRQKSRMPSSA